MNTKYNQGVIIGRFLPPHNGHCYLIRFALAQVHNLTLFLCSLPNEPISGEQRRLWLQQLFPAINIIHISEGNQAAERGQPQAVDIWAHTIRARLKVQIDLLFASEHYGSALAHALGGRFVAVDIDRRVVPVHARQILQNPLQYWDYLPSVVRTFFLPRVLCLFRQKSVAEEVATALATHFHTQWVKNSWSFISEGEIDHSSAIETSVEQIVQAYIASEEALALYANRILFTASDQQLQTSARWQQHLQHGYHLIVTEEDYQQWLPAHYKNRQRLYIAPIRNRCKKTIHFVGRWLSALSVFF